MAMQTKKSWQDYLTASFGQHGYSKPLAQMLEVGAVAEDGTIFQRLPIGTSSAGTAVKVDLISAEAVSVNVGSVGIQGFTGTAGTATLVNLVCTNGTLLTQGSVTGVGTVVGLGTLAGVGTIAGVGAIGNLAGGSVVVTTGTIGTVSGERFSYYHYTIGSGTIKTSAGVVHAVNINNYCTAPVTLYDSNGTSAATVATFFGSALNSYILDANFTTGITIAGTMAAAGDITVIWK